MIHRATPAKPNATRCPVPKGKRVGSNLRSSSKTVAANLVPRKGGCSQEASENIQIQNCAKTTLKSKKAKTTKGSIEPKTNVSLKRTFTESSISPGQAFPAPYASLSLEDNIASFLNLNSESQIKNLVEQLRRILKQRLAKPSKQELPP